MNFTTINNIGSIVTIISFIPICYAACTYISVKRIQKEHLKKIRKFEPREKSAILIIDVGEANVSMRNKVEGWIESQDEFKGYPPDNIYHIPCIKRICENDIDDLLEKVRKYHTKIMASGAIKIHLFYRGPIALAAIIASEFKNGRPVIFYQMDNEEGRYVNWGPIER